jgi:sugar lactone lactonase YvrE
MRAVSLILLTGILSLTAWGQSAPTPTPTPTPAPTPAPLSYTAGTLVAAGTLFQPEGLAQDAAGNLYVADAGNNVVRTVNTVNGSMSIFAGTVGRTYRDDNPALPATCRKNGDGCGPALATFGSPRSVAIDAAGDIFISDFWSSTIRRVDASSGNISTYAGNAGGWSSTSLHNAEGIAVDAAGNLYIADRGNNAVRKVTPPAAPGSQAVMTTIAGLGPNSPGCSGDGGKAVAAALTLPQDVAVDAAGNIYIADTGCRKVRIITPDGNIATLVGVGGTPPAPGDAIPYNPAPQPGLSAVLAKPVALTIDGAGHLFIADPWIDAIWLYDLAGLDAYVVAGMGPKSRALAPCVAATNASGDGCPATQAHINAGYRVAIGPSGVVYVPEHGGGKNPLPPFTIRMLTPVAPAIQGAGGGN